MSAQAMLTVGPRMFTVRPGRPICGARATPYQELWTPGGPNRVLLFAVSVDGEIDVGVARQLLGESPGLGDHGLLVGRLREHLTERRGDLLPVVPPLHDQGRETGGRDELSDSAGCRLPARTSKTGDFSEIALQRLELGVSGALSPAHALEFLPHFFDSGCGFLE